jgi:membrane fusion protein (multidrug efflux system)
MEYLMLKTDCFLDLESAALRNARVFRKIPLRRRLMLLAVGTIVSAGCGKMGLPPAGPPDVEVVQVLQKDVPISQSWVATFDGLVNANIRAQVNGLLMKQTYVNGAFVPKGAPLFLIDPRPFQAALDQATGSLNQSKADLEVAKASVGKNDMDVKRYTPLVKTGAISQQEMDDAIQNDLGARAKEQAAIAAISAAQAAVESAKINLGFTKIVAPIGGVAGIANAQVGDFVGPQGAVLTTVSTVNPILVSFTPSEQEYLRAMSQTWGKGLSEDEALRKLEWHVTLTNGSEYPYTGRFYALDRQVDIRTGAIMVQVQVPNPGNVLRPGGYGSVKTVVRIQPNALLVPQRSVSELQGGFEVAIIGSDNKAHIVPVKMGDKIGDMWIVAAGLKAGERVVAEGVQKVQEGMLVNPKPYQPGTAVAENSKP